MTKIKASASQPKENCKPKFRSSGGLGEEIRVLHTVIKQNKRSLPGKRKGRMTDNQQKRRRTTFGSESAGTKKTNSNAEWKQHLLASVSDFSDEEDDYRSEVLEEALVEKVKQVARDIQTMNSALKTIVTYFETQKLKSE